MAQPKKTQRALGEAQREEMIALPTKKEILEEDKEFEREAKDLQKMVRGKRR